MNDSVKFSRSLVAAACRGFHCMMTRATPRNASALNEMRSGAPSSGSSKPPRAGPTIPERFSCTPPSVIAEGSSSLLTMSGTTAPQTGAPKASPIPSAKTHASTAPGFITSVHAPKARTADQAACQRTALNDHRAPVHDVSNGSCWQREEKERRGCSGCHQREQVRRSAKIVHQPRRSNVLRRDERSR